MRQVIHERVQQVALLLQALIGCRQFGGAVANALLQVSLRLQQVVRQAGVHAEERHDAQQAEEKKQRNAQRQEFIARIDRICSAAGEHRIEPYRAAEKNHASAAAITAQAHFRPVTRMSHTATTAAANWTIVATRRIAGPICIIVPNKVLATEARDDCAMAQGDRSRVF